MGSAGLSQVATAQAQDDTSGNADPLPGAAAEETVRDRAARL
jgi:hypothetical protein